MVKCVLSRGSHVTFRLYASRCSSFSIQVCTDWVISDSSLNTWEDILSYINSFLVEVIGVTQSSNLTLILVIWHPMALQVVRQWPRHPLLSIAPQHVTRVTYFAVEDGFKKLLIIQPELQKKLTFGLQKIRFWWMHWYQNRNDNFWEIFLKLQ